jgi:hypothetical protein
MSDETIGAKLVSQHMHSEPSPASTPFRRLGGAQPKLKPELVEPTVRLWSEVVVPEGANELETLTYVPGLVGDIVEWIASSARRPNRMMALGVASVVVGTIIGRRIEGPTDSATHLYIILLAPTGYGKDHPLQCGSALMHAAGRCDLLGPGEWASAPGFVKRIKRNPLMVCFVDELGDELAKVSESGGGGVWVTAITGLLKKCYNAWATINTAEKVSEESERIDWPAVSIIGAATPEMFFNSLQPRDLESGFANRLLILPFEGYGRPREQSPRSELKDPPKELVAGLRALPKQSEIAEQILNSPADGPPRPKLERVEWGAGAEEVYLTFSRDIDTLEDGDRQRYELSMRACENAVRLATNVAVGRGSPTVDCEDIVWAIATAQQSLDAAYGGVAQYMRQHFEFPKFCDRVLEWLAAQPTGFASRREIERKFRGNARNSFDIGNVLDQLLREERIEKASGAFGSRGPATTGYRVVEGEEK